MAETTDLTSLLTKLTPMAPPKPMATVVPTAVADRRAVSCATTRTLPMLFRVIPRTWDETRLSTVLRMSMPPPAPAISPADTFTASASTPKIRVWLRMAVSASADTSSLAATRASPYTVRVWAVSAPTSATMAWRTALSTMEAPTEMAPPMPMAADMPTPTAMALLTCTLPRAAMSNWPNTVASAFHMRARTAPAKSL